MIPIPAVRAGDAAATDILYFEKSPWTPAVYERKAIVEKIAVPLLSGAHTMLVGPTGTGKSALLGALLLGGGLKQLAIALGFGPSRSSRTIPVEISGYDSASELRRRRGLVSVDGASQTVWEEGAIPTAFREAVSPEGEDYVYYCWLKELSQAASPTIYASLLELISYGPVHLSRDEIVPGDSVTFVADSNWTAAGQYNNQELSEALQRRFVQVYLDYHSAEVEDAVLRHMTQHGVFVRHLGKRVSVPTDYIAAVVAMGQEIRQQKEEGYLRSVPQVSYKSYQQALELQAMRQGSIQDAVIDIMLGGASPTGEDAVTTSLASVFGQVDDLMGVF